LIALEIDSNYRTDNSVFGISNIKLDVCKLTIGYLLSSTQLTVLLPESCHFCQKSAVCSRKFSQQVIHKLNKKYKGKV